MTIANTLTLLRVFISPLFLLAYLYHDFLGIGPLLLPYALLLLLSVSETTDALDGFFARRYNQVSDFGKVVDPMADSVSRLTYLFAFTEPPVKLPLILAFLFLYRDSVISALRTLCALHGFALAASNKGKLKAVMQAIAVTTTLLIMIPHSLGMISDNTLQTVSITLVSLAALLALYSGIDYLWVNRSVVARLLAAKKAV